MINFLAVLPKHLRKINEEKKIQMSKYGFVTARINKVHYSYWIIKKPPILRIGFLLTVLWLSLGSIMKNTKIKKVILISIYISIINKTICTLLFRC